MATFHERLLADDVLPATVRTTLGLTDPDSVYSGRRPRKPRQPHEVLVRHVRSELARPGGGDEPWVHEYTLEIYRAGVGNSTRSGAEQLDEAKADAQGLVLALDGTRPWTVELSGDVLAVRAQERTVDVLPEGSKAVTATVDLFVVTRGPGTA